MRPGLHAALRPRPSRAGRRHHAQGQGVVEFALVVPVFLLLLLGMLEFGLAFDHTLTLSYATREGARVGAALGNGGGVLGCGGGQSPDAATVDPQIVAAVQRVLSSPGSPIIGNRIQELRLFRATSAGQPITGDVNVWRYAPGGGPIVDGIRLNFTPVSVGWSACERNNGRPPDSIGISLVYRYRFSTPLGNLIGGSGFPITDRTVMALNPGS